MRMARSDGIGWVSWLAIGAGVFLVVAAIGLTVYGGMVRPHQHMMEQVVPNDRFPT